ncbi:serine/threonine transporter SstT [Dialister sp.]|uniref:serine/threonine transporter SstT n=1 Tax=uncultured Dialister sp. TaxID=278064 RepID=UPI0025EFB0DF|nr:serine/threonine transporter SstT [Dialister sp.]
MISKLRNLLSHIKLIHQIAMGLVLGIILAIGLPESVPLIRVFGDLFVKALKSVAPVLVFFLVINAIAQKKPSQGGNMKPVITLYMTSTFFASIVGVTFSFLFPTSLALDTASAASNAAAPSGIGEVLYNLVMSTIDNPVSAILKANYISILVWAIIFGVALKSMGGVQTKQFLDDTAKAVTKIVGWVIHLAPLGIMGLVANSVGSEGLSALLGYMKLLAVLISAYATVALVINPLLVFTRIHRNPYPLVLTTLKESGIYAFFTRSSAANIPVNLSLCCRLGLDPDMYTISIPLGAAVNTAGASVTISVLSLAAAYTLGIHVDIPTALLLCLVATIGACGSSGVAGGSLLLIPVACASFGINNDIAMQVVGVGFIISVLEDACETALNSSSDVLFTATAEFEKRRKEGTLKSGDMELRRG